MTATVITSPDNKSCLVTEKKSYKILSSNCYNYIFNKKTGEHIRWGATEQDDPVMSPFGPEIADIEISTICSGINGKVCGHCYKSNTSNGDNMDLETFKIIFDKFPVSITQIAFGIGDIDSNPHMYDIFGYCRNNGRTEVIPNVTINGDRLTDYHINRLSELCGAVAVSLYDEDLTYNAIKRLSDTKLSSVNMHVVLSEENYSNCLKAVDAYKTDSRLKNLGAIVFLSLKPKGRGSAHTALSNEKFESLVKICIEGNVPIGFDSCTAPRFLAAVKSNKSFYEKCLNYVESCESSRMSSYINHKGEYWHCSFAEGHPTCKSIDMINGCKNFLTDLWYNPEVERFRQAILNNHVPELSHDCYRCPIFNIDTASEY